MKNRKRKLAFTRTLRKYESTGVIMALSGECPRCGRNEIFLINCYDDEACLHCNAWVHEPCRDPFCFYCANRPSNPAGAFFLLKEKVRRCEQQGRKDWLRANYQHKHNGEVRHQKQKLLYQELKNKGG